MRYYGIFEKMHNLDLNNLQDIDLYEGYFSEKYDSILGTYSKENEIYLSNACCLDGDILELACGTGRILIDLAKRGFRVKGVDYSKDMLQQLENKLKRCSPRVRNNITHEQGDIFEYCTDEKYGLVIIPATTICLLLDDFQKAVRLFENVYEMLDEGGRFIFDYRIDQDDRRKRCSTLEMKTVEKEEYKEFVMFQEFDNYIPQQSVVNFYAERIYPTHTERYMTSSNKKIVTDELVKKIVSKTKFKVWNEEVVLVGEEVNIKYLTLYKSE
ncbi:class I SAM-dependent methyltransferase [Clostridium gasigenes]|uniref:class I SAM-dependent DNA methyltransferase n=1 Tax=Clostridium gasigenes TaxID=94869 RepID=UPI001C0E60B5|nr:class I SAM-dependent methyltransferase [Clostridium gasigenes]MBU3089197.1 class I SAM-dependent methyltransferase [Clostridium gasigenes]